MSNKWIGQILCLLIIAMAASGCVKRRLTEAELIQKKREEKAAYVPRLGTNRQNVERVFGAPTHTGQTKTGDVWAMYEIQQNRYRSIAYGSNAEVLSVYPPEPLKPIDVVIKPD